MAITETLLVLSTGLKLLLFEGYRSTDFEVHRNWLAVTHSLPLARWYYDTTSEWTLDYPPLFAYAEWALSQAGALVDPAMVQLQNLNHASRSTVAFQRGSVMLTELLLIHADRRLALLPAFLILDHVHFQYNGALVGLLVLAIRNAHTRPTLSAFLFATLLCFKHIYLYLAPAFFVLFLRTIVLRFDVRRIASLGLAVLVPVVIAFGPFYAHITQLLERLFPFSRGLTHAYWAPNAWALYAAADRLLSRALGVHAASATRGLVGDTAMAVLPDVSPRATFFITLAAMAPPLVQLFVRPTRDNFRGALTLCGFASFLFGWHVHEKAVLNCLVPALLWLAPSDDDGDDRLPAATAHEKTSTETAGAKSKQTGGLGEEAVTVLMHAGHYCLLPLLPAREQLLCLGYTLIYVLLRHRPSRFLSRAYCWGFAPVLLFLCVLHPLLLGDKEGVAFLPLLLLSVYGAVGVVGSWMALLFVYLTQQT